MYRLVGCKDSIINTYKIMTACRNITFMMEQQSLLLSYKHIETIFTCKY